MRLLVEATEEDVAEEAPTPPPVPAAEPRTPERRRATAAKVSSRLDAASEAVRLGSLALMEALAEFFLSSVDWWEEEEGGGGGGCWQETVTAGTSAAAEVFGLSFSTGGGSDRSSPPAEVVGGAVDEVVRVSLLLPAL